MENLSNTSEDNQPSITGETSNSRIRIGLLGAGTWALMAHVNILSRLPEYELVAVYARRPDVSEKAADEYGFRFVASTVEELVNHPEVDLIVVTTPTPNHADGVRAALNAGKNVYCEWPLTTNTAIAKELTCLARSKGLRQVVGLQRRLSPHNRYLKDLLDQGFIGEIRSVNIRVSIEQLGKIRNRAQKWSLPIENFANVITIYAGHFLDMIFTATGWPGAVSAIQTNHFSTVTIEDTGEILQANSLDELVLIGRLGDKGVVTAQIEGGKRNGSGVQIDITGFDGDLRITNKSAFGGIGENYLIEGANGEERYLKPMPVPDSYNWFLYTDLPTAVLELGQLYAAYASDVNKGTHLAPTFEDALHLHQFFDALETSTATGKQVTAEA
jgi:predicted dehydrogenase